MVLFVLHNRSIEKEHHCCLSFLRLNLRNVLPRYHDQAQKAAGHVHFHGGSRGGCRNLFRRSFECIGRWWTVLIGLREYYVAFLARSIICYKSSEDLAHIISTSKFPHEHPRIGRVKLQPFSEHGAKEFFGSVVIHDKHSFYGKEKIDGSAIGGCWRMSRSRSHG